MASQAKVPILMQHVVVGTAGHIDHGKSALVMALTGTDPDRLREEKERGITIDLGFAHTTEQDVVLSFVDVPGHERFVRNMLAGVGGMDLVMLHVAADESVMPQTHEHFDICRLLQVPAGLVVVTKSDLADRGMRDVVRLEVQELVSGSFLDGAPIVEVSARTGEGVAELRRTLVSLAATTRRRITDDAPRLPIDRVFSLKGFGTVVTGTLVAGRLTRDDELVLLPSGRAVKVRGLHVHGETQTSAMAGQRVAVNLAGVEVADVSRGETLTSPGAVTVTKHVDVRLDLLPSARPLNHGARVRFHQGTREVAGRVVLPDATALDPGSAASVRVHLAAPVVLVRGDRFILRAQSPLSTIGGGSILDPSPPRRGVRTAAGQARLARLQVSEAEAVMVMIHESGLSGLPVSQVAGRAGVSGSHHRALIDDVTHSGRARAIGSVLVDSSHLSAAEDAVMSVATRHHASHPLEEGVPREELRERVFADASPQVFEHVLRALEERKRIVARERVALAGHSVALTDDEARARDALIEMLRDAGLAPPDLPTLATRTGLPLDVVNRIATLLVRRSILIRAGDLVFHESALSRLKSEIQALKQSASTATIDVGTFKERYNVTRKYAIPLLEYLDRERVTRRVGDTRKIL
ncbi:MAG TPA: selenocysteine-specific translation elongation factor [Vicinamibacterales bacterium]|nr:selenocysteine-specific translation elongation factor [Vicinamibacterales bacterium]